MDELAPPHAPAPTPDELGRLRARMAEAVAGCAECLTTVVDLAEAKPSGPAARRERCDGLCDAINSLSELSSGFHQAHRDAGRGWPADAPAGLTFTAVASTLLDAFFLAHELDRTLCGLGQDPGPRTAALITGLRRAVRVLEDAAEYLRAGGGWSPFVSVPFDAERENAEHAEESRAAIEHGVSVLDKVSDGRQMIPITGRSCLIVPGRVPSVCPHADPVVHPTLLGAVRRVLLEGVQREFLNGAVLPDGATLHWVGRVAAARSSGTCPCHPAAPTAAPAHAHLWAAVGSDGGEGDGESSGTSGAAAGSPRKRPGPKPTFDPATAKNVRDIIHAAHARSDTSKLVGHRGWKQSAAVAEAVQGFVKDGTCESAESVWGHYEAEASRLRGKKRNDSAE